MEAFTLDTSGYVDIGPTVHSPGQGRTATVRYRWSDLSPFVRGFIGALFASLIENRWAALSERFGADLISRAAWLAFSDLSPEALALILKDCEAALGDRLCGYSNAVVHGEMFWRDRQANQLNGMDPRFPPLTVSLSDEGKVLLAEAA